MAFSKDSGEAEVALLMDLLGEQKDKAIRRAQDDRSKVSATWIAKGDHLVLLVVNVVGLHKVEKKIYKCRVLDVVEDANV